MVMSPVLLAQGRPQAAGHGRGVQDGPAHRIQREIVLVHHLPLHLVALVHVASLEVVNLAFDLLAGEPIQEVLQVRLPGDELVLRRSAVLANGPGPQGAVARVRHDDRATHE